MQGGTDHEFSFWTDEDDRALSPRLLAQERAQDRVRWHGRASWHPVLTYTTVMLASGWLAGAWYAWVINGDGAELAICLGAALSTIWPGIPWRELIAMAKRDVAPGLAPGGRNDWTSPLSGRGTRYADAATDVPGSTPGVPIKPPAPTRYP